MNLHISILQIIPDGLAQVLLFMLPIFYRDSIRGSFKKAKEVLESLTGLVLMLKQLKTLHWD
jgi:hypothetical protein